MHLFWFTSAIAFFLSFTAKLLAEHLLPGDPRMLMQTAGLRYSENPGVAFGVQLPGALQSVLIACAMVFVLVLALRSDPRAPTQIGYGLIIGGAVTNVIDRFMDGFVTDFVQIGSFPIFNIADSCITIGVAVLLAEYLRLFSRCKTMS